MSDYIGKLRDTRTPACRCPYCGHNLDAAMSGNPKNPDAVPKPGDVSVCISCASVLVFKPDLTLRGELYPGEVPINEVIRRAQQAVRMLDRRKMRN